MVSVATTRNLSRRVFVGKTPPPLRRLENHSAVQDHMGINAREAKADRHNTRLVRNLCGIYFCDLIWFTYHQISNNQRSSLPRIASDDGLGVPEPRHVSSQRILASPVVFKARSRPPGTKISCFILQ